MNEKYRWCEDVTVSDLAVEEVKTRTGERRSQVTAILGKDVSKITCGELRSICVKLRVRGYGNKRKDGLLELLAASKLNGASHYEKKPKKEIQCPFRLVNILFSDAFVGRLTRIGDKVTRLGNNSGKLTEEVLFWRDVQIAFVDESANEIVSKLHFRHPALDKKDVDPSKVVRHDWKSLRRMFKGMKDAYKRSLTYFGAYGRRGDFYSYCRGRLDAWYLHLHVQLFPDTLVAFVDDVHRHFLLSKEESIDEMSSSCTSSSEKMSLQMMLMLLLYEHNINTWS